MVIFSGCFLFALGFLGGWGTIRENKTLMMIYLGLNIITLILEIVGVVVAFCSYPDAKHFLKSTMDIYKNEEVLSSCLGTFSVKFKP